MKRTASRTPGYVRGVARCGAEIFSAQELQSVSHRTSDLSMRDRWVGSSQELVLCICAALVPVCRENGEGPSSTLIVVTGHSSGRIMLRRVGSSVGEDAADGEPEPLTLPLEGAVRALALASGMLAAGTESGVVQLVRIALLDGCLPDTIRADVLARVDLGGECEAIALSASALRLSAGCSGAADGCSGLHVWDVSLPLTPPLDDALDGPDASDDDDELTGRTGAKCLVDCFGDAALQPELQADVYAIAMRADGAQLVAGSSQGDVWLWAWPARTGAPPELMWSTRRAGAVQAVGLTASGLVVAASDHKPDDQSAAGTAVLLLRSDDGPAREVELPNSRSIYCKDAVCEGGVQRPWLTGGGMWCGEWKPVPLAADTVCPVCSSAFPVVLATCLVDEPDGTTTLIFGGYGRQIERWSAVFGGGAEDRDR